MTVREMATGIRPQVNPPPWGATTAIGPIRGLARGRAVRRAMNLANQG